MGRRPSNAGRLPPAGRPPVMGGPGRPRYWSERRDSYGARGGSSRYPSVRSSWQDSHNGKSQQNGHTNRIIGTNNSTVGNLRGAPPPPREIFVSRVVDGDTKIDD